MEDRQAPQTGDHFRDIIEIMKTLRAPDGCPWDAKQTLESAIEDLLSEAEEVREAIKKGDTENLREELGDLLWGIVFTANIAKENNLFDIQDILRETREKIIRRHPHVFGKAKAVTPEDAMRLFQSCKASETHAKKDD
jgi:uncharacterized protein YabN with tetrapyrrole methylase and pyrophosphatase domain